MLRCKNSSQAVSVRLSAHTHARTHTHTHTPCEVMAARKNKESKRSGSADEDVLCSVFTLRAAA